jgi:hypothetical protein
VGSARRRRPRYALARLAPRRVLDRITTARMRTLALRGHFDARGIAGEYAARLRER